MEHLDGIDLRTLQKQRGALPVGEAATYILQACEAIAEAHQSGIIHRDLKPANLFLASGVGGRPCLKILDFGIAKVVEGTNPATSSEHLTSTYAVMGTPFFMSPEQIISTRDVDGRSDIWSLGVILYSFVTGQFPFTGSNSYDIFDEVRRKEPTSPSVMQPDIPLAFTTIILRCLEKDPTRRFQECAELAQALLPFASSRSELSFPSVPIASTMLDLGMSTPGQDAPSTRTVPGGLIPLARLAVVEPHPAQTGAPTTQMPPGPTATPRQSRAITLLGGALGLALVLAAGLTLRRFHGEPSAEPAATSFTVTSLASTASAQPTAALLIVPSSVAAAAPPSASAEGAVLATGSPGGRSSGAPKNADGEQKLRKSAAEPKPPATLMPTSAGPVTPPPPAQTAAPVAASSKAPSKSRWDDRNQ